MSSAYILYPHPIMGQGREQWENPREFEAKKVRRKCLEFLSLGLAEES